MANIEKCIIGIDPGTTTGLAFVSLTGKVRATLSERHFSSEMIVEEILERCHPLVVATDKQKVPSLVEEIATNFGCEIYSPDEDLSNTRKESLTEGYEFDNPHEMDALAAALVAYNSYKNKFKRIEKKMDNLNLSNLIPEIKELVIKGEVNSIAQAIEITLSGPESGEVVEEKVEREETGIDISRDELENKLENQKQRLYKEIKDRRNLEEYVEKLREELDELESRKKELEEENKKLSSKAKADVVKDEEFKRLKKKLQSNKNKSRKLSQVNEELSKKNERLRTYIKLERENKIPVRECHTFNLEEIYEMEELLTLYNSFVLVNGNISTDEKFLKRITGKVKAIIGDFDDDTKDILNSYDIETISKENVELKKMNGVLFLEEGSDRKSKSFDKDGFVSWLKKYRSRRE